LDEQKVPLTARPQILVNVLAVILCVFFAVGVVVVIYIFHRLKREKMKKLLAIETARAAVVTQWTKKVIVEKQKQIEEELLMPVVKIEKQKSTVIAEDSNNDNVSEYELPLDSAWELSREYFMLGSTLGEGAFGKVIRAETNSNRSGVPTVVAVKMLKGKRCFKANVHASLYRLYHVQYTLYIIYRIFATRIQVAIENAKELST